MSEELSIRVENVEQIRADFFREDSIAPPVYHFYRIDANGGRGAPDCTELVPGREDRHPEALLSDEVGY